MRVSWFVALAVCGGALVGCGAASMAPTDGGGPLPPRDRDDISSAFWSEGEIAPALAAAPDGRLLAVWISATDSNTIEAGYRFSADRGETWSMPGRFASPTNVPVDDLARCHQRDALRLGAARAGGRAGVRQRADRSRGRGERFAVLLSADAGRDARGRDGRHRGPARRADVDVHAVARGGRRVELGRGRVRDGADVAVLGARGRAAVAGGE